MSSRKQNAPQTPERSSTSNANVSERPCRNDDLELDLPTKSDVTFYVRGNSSPTYKEIMGFDFFQSKSTVQEEYPVFFNVPSPEPTSLSPVPTESDKKEIFSSLPSEEIFRPTAVHSSKFSLGIDSPSPELDFKKEAEDTYKKILYEANYSTWEKEDSSRAMLSYLVSEHKKIILEMTDVVRSKHLESVAKGIAVFKMYKYLLSMLETSMNSYIIKCRSIC